MVFSKSPASGVASSIAFIARSGVWSGACVLTGWLAASSTRSAASCGLRVSFSKALRLRRIKASLKLSTRQKIPREDLGEGNFGKRRNDVTAVDLESVFFLSAHEIDIELRDSK